MHRLDETVRHNVEHARQAARHQPARSWDRAPRDRRFSDQRPARGNEDRIHLSHGDGRPRLVAWYRAASPYAAIPVFSSRSFAICCRTRSSTPTGGKLLLGCRRRGDKLRIEVWDTGPGIPELELQAIFEEFHQLDNPARERSKGLGLGLAIVQRLADLLGHKIDVRSRLGTGSVFTVEVPLGRLEAAQSPVADQDKTQANAPLRGTILIVEDDPAVLEMLQMLFDDEGHRTLVAADGHKALELAAQGSTTPDLVVADYNLPNGLNGLEIIAKLQEQAQRAIPAIILTGDISADSLREIAGHGCVHLNKPVRARS